MTMKINIILFLIAGSFFSCSTPTDKIKDVETSLIDPVYIKGDSTWTIEERMAHYGVPGVSIAVIKDSKIEWVKSYGVMDKKSKVPVTPRTLFQAGSISKPVAAYGALRLVSAGRIKLDENINTYLKSWQLPDNKFTKEKKVTLKHLLSHSGGTSVHGFLGYSPDLPVPSLSQVLNGTAPANSAAIRVDKLPGTSFRYSGGGYCIMQQMMIDQEGKPFPTIMQELVLKPLDMKNSTYDQPLEKAQISLAATGYLPDGSMTKGKRHIYPEMAAAGLWTTAEDLAKFAINIQQTLAGKNNVVLPQGTVKIMLTPYVADFIGLGIFLDKRKDDLYFGHGGWDEGFSSQLLAHTKKGYGVVVLTNANQPAFIEELIRAVALTYQWDNMVPIYKKAASDAASDAKIIGRYRKGNDALMNIYQKDGKLWVKNIEGSSFELVKISDSTYITRKQNEPIQFKTNKRTRRLNLLVLNPDKGHVEATFSQMEKNEKLPTELLMDGNFDAALKAYRELMKNDPNDPALNEDKLNQKGYFLLNSGKQKFAQQIFKINMLLYPTSANVYDSYAEASMKLGELDIATANYKKTLSLNPENENAVKMLKEIQQMKTSTK